MSKTPKEIRQENGKDRIVLQENGRSRVALPMAYIENCTTELQQRYLWRFYEAYEFANALRHPVNSDGEPVGQYAPHASVVSPEDYIRLEVQAFQWIRKYALGQEWAMAAELYLRMMSERTNISILDWGRERTNSVDEKIALGGAQVTLKDLAIRLKDAYRDFFRWYKYVKECEEKNREPTGAGALDKLEREQVISEQLSAYRKRYAFLDQG